MLSDTYTILCREENNYTVINQLGVDIWHRQSIRIEFIEDADIYRECLGNGKYRLWEIEDNLTFDFIEENRIYWGHYFPSEPTSADYFKVFRSGQFPNQIYAELGFAEGSVLFVRNGNIWNCIIPYCINPKLIEYCGTDYFLSLNKGFYTLYDETGKKLLTAAEDLLLDKGGLVEKILLEVKKA